MSFRNILQPPKPYWEAGKDREDRPEDSNAPDPATNTNDAMKSEGFQSVLKGEQVPNA